MNPLPITKLLVATDGSKTSDRAVFFAAKLARAYHARLVICLAVDSAATLASCTVPYGSIDGGELVAGLDDAARVVLERASEIARREDVPIATRLLVGPAAECVVACAAAEEADALVVGTQGKDALERFFLGSTAEEILRHSEVPTFVVPPLASAEPTPIDRILVALDTEASSDGAFRFALSLARAATTLVLCSVVESQDLYNEAATDGYDPEPRLADLRRAAHGRVDRCVEFCKARDVPFEVAVVEGAAAETIVKVAKTRLVDLLAIGTHGRKGFQRMFLGSVAEHVVRAASMPVAVVRTSRESPR